MGLRIALLALPSAADDPRLRFLAGTLAGRGDDVTVFSIGEKALGAAQVVEIGRALSLPGLSTFELPWFTLEAGARLARAHLQQPFDLVLVRLGKEIVLLDTLFPRLGGAKLVVDVDPAAGLEHHPARMRALALAADAMIVSLESQYRAILVAGAPAYQLNILRDAPELTPRAAEPKLSGRDPFRLVLAAPLGTLIEAQILPALIAARASEPRLALTVLTGPAGCPSVEEEVRRLGIGPEGVELFACPDAAARGQAIASAMGAIAAGDQSTELPPDLAEYLAVGVPAIAIRPPWAASEREPRELLRVDPGDVAGLTQAMIVLMRDKNRRKALASAAEAWRDEFGVEKQKALLVRVVDFCCAEKVIAQRRARQAAIEGVKTGTRRSPPPE